ncbi:maleylpyruvate isomerase family mycothiol-dependent enzyme [Yinghuangia soli]|uniref:Maleylpyruvate isomerase family mycothiol-dependent enzyme n=1 Tax=Yinghuangia soli TaxID=2908204 RepID=A0AA41Q706_9ACTN|nr:maleylpyruvate isomerase family mycothiol-dependent enzyme [Yinghuangia soli]MCF2532759.1 maleylpyruvate isomerase family mycothiol-dependent enzyme [Yinghuangia soli]
MAEPDYRWTHDEYCELFVAEADRIAALLAGADLGTPVPTCPEWTLAKLAKHLGIAHAWSAANVKAGPDGGPVAPRSLDLGLPADPAGLPEWLAAGARRSADFLREAGPDAPAWTFGPVPHARFWGRRMLHETMVHRLDTEIALGIAPEIAPETAVDGIDELLTILPGVAGRTVAPGGGETLHVHTSGGDVPGEWTVTLAPEGYRWERGHAKGDAALRGPAADVLLVMTRRRDAGAALAAGAVELFGDRAVLDKWLAASAL